MSNWNGVMISWLSAMSLHVVHDWLMLLVEKKSLMTIGGKLASDVVKIVNALTLVESIGVATTAPSLPPERYHTNALAYQGREWPNGLQDHLKHILLLQPTVWSPAIQIKPPADIAEQRSTSMVSTIMDSGSICHIATEARCACLLLTCAAATLLVDDMHIHRIEAWNSYQMHS